MSLFDTYIIVDWSASNVPKRGKDSIWICKRHRDGEEQLCNPPTRHAARILLAEMIATAIGWGDRVLAGFDFPFGYPAGFAGRLGLPGIAWRATWDEIARLIDDRENNHNNRFGVSAELNRRISDSLFPFWGCPAHLAGQFLGTRHHRGHTAGEALKECRLIDEWMVGAQPCWKLAYTGSVGSQVLTGLPVVRALRDDPRWANRARIWPFETGLSLGEDARIVFAEVWPSWWKWKETQEPGEIPDRAQVRHVAELFAARGSDGALASWFSPPIAAERRRDVLAEEAWTLGVMEPRPRKAPKRPRPAA
jgi:precorrin-8X/cobalt-precorrin-8 methylmutase